MYNKFFQNKVINLLVITENLDRIFCNGLTDYLTLCPSLLILRNIDGVKEEKLSFMSFSGVSCLLLLILFLMHLLELYSGLLIDLKLDLVVGQLPLLSFCLLTVNKSARQLFILFLIC